MSELQNKLLEEFRDAEYAHAYMESYAHDKLVGQIHWTRKARNWTQAQLAEHAGMAQARISKIESGEFDSLTVSTIRRLARALDVTVRLELEPFSHGIYDVCHQSRATLELPNREESLSEMRACTAMVAGLYGIAPIFVNAVTPPVVTVADYDSEIVTTTGFDVESPRNAVFQAQIHE
jgi:transcriptional regulator with XRE-family HTH domain